MIYSYAIIVYCYDIRLLNNNDTYTVGGSTEADERSWTFLFAHPIANVQTKI